ncbi:MAG TPA: M1 family metallopeptidase [Vicinamibacterales bacterium]|nr:M1 family metallopeptidase [Vicinamibacterales bacterium]
MFGRLVVMVILLALSGAGAPEQPPATGVPGGTGMLAAPRSPRNANYRMTARLDPRSRTLRGEGLLTWRNISARPADTLQFHLYWNAWRNTRSSWMRERQRAGDTTLSRRPEPDWAWIDLTSISRIGTEGAPIDLTSHLRFIAPDDGNADDRTVAEVQLDAPVAPGETVNVQIAWSSYVPRTFARTGTIGSFYFLAHWFPKIGVLEDDGWNTHQFHSTTEFFADFGIYDVRLTVPAGWVVGATGLERGRRDEADGTTTHHYYAEDVHDFAWTTSPDYLERTATFEHPNLPHVAMRLLLQPEHAGQADRHFEATRAALKHYGEWYGPYPYGNVTIVDPAWQSGAGGMEYPTLFTAGTRWLAPRRVAQPESVTVHEAGHQFWYGIVANNEFEHAWMDEGLNTFSTARTLEQFFQPYYYSKRYFGGFVPWVFYDLPISRATDGNRLPGYRPAARADAQSTPTWQYWPGTAGAISYNKTALWLHTLERMLGWEVLQRILSTYYARWSFRHPRPQDFFAVVNEVSGRDLTWFFDQVHRGSNAFDYGVQTFRSERAGDRGHFGDGERRAFSSEPRPGQDYTTTVVVRRHGEGIFPVPVRVVFEDGEEVRWEWDGRSRWKLFEVDRPSRARSVEVDPDRMLLLDVDYTNNSMSLRPRAAEAARKWSLAWLIWLQDQLLTYGFFI